MLGIEINGEFLDLPPGANMELQEENPFLQFAEDKVLGNYSLPIEFIASDKNLRLTDFVAIIQKRVSNKGLAAKLYYNGIQHSSGRLKFDKIPHHINQLDRTKINAYYLYGSSDFYQDIKDLKLRDIDVGGDRSFAWDNYATSGPGFWGHLTTVIRSATPQDYDYCFFPVINKTWFNEYAYGGIPTELMNNIKYESGNLVLPNRTSPSQVYTFLNVIVPFPWLHYVLKKAVEYTGWKIEGDIFNDPDFLKVCLINFYAIDYGFAPYADAPNPGDGIIQNDPVIFNLKNNLPDITIAEFLSSLRKRMGWWYEFNHHEKKIIIRDIYQAAISSIKDMTPYASPIIPKKVNNESNVYSLKNNFSSELGNGQPSFKQGEQQGNVDEIADLPAADDSNFGHVYLVRSENNFYKCVLDDAGNPEWQFYTYNIYDYVPAEANQEIITNATTVGVEYYDDYIDQAPRIDYYGILERRIEGEPSWGVILCFYHGIVNNKSGVPINYGSSHIYDPQNNQVAQWALTFSCQKFDGTDVGLYERKWKNFLSVVNVTEEVQVTLQLPLYKFLQLKFNDRININGVLMFIKTIKRVIPYKDMVEVECVRI